MTRPIRVLAEWLYELELQGPFLTHSSEAGPWGVDLICARDALGRLYIPGTQVRGRVREAFDDIGTDPRGSRQGDLTKVEQRDHPGEGGPSRYPILFSDFIAEGEPPAPGEQVLARTAIDRETHAAEETSLRVLDSPLGPGETLTFRGSIRFASDDQEENETLGQEIEKALRWVAAWGSGKSVGMGRALDARALAWRDHCYWLHEPAHTYDQQTMAHVEWTLQDPLCVPRGAVKGNIFESDSDLRGEALKGAVAQSLREIFGLAAQADVAEASDSDDFGALCQHFSAIRFTTARPANRHRRDLPLVRPQSLCVANGKLYDMALVEQWDDETFAPCIDGTAVAFAPDWKTAAPCIDGTAVAFAPDWKTADAQAVAAAFPEATLKQELRVRTAVESDKRRAANEQLFAYRLIRPEGITWHSTISFEHADNQVQAQVWEQLRRFLDMGWIHIGKTKARMCGMVTRWMDADELRRAATDKDVWQDSDLCVVTLQSQALLLDPRQLVDGEGCIVAQPELTQKYADAWKQLSGESFELVRCFTKHRLIGGYQAYRFRRQDDNPHQAYYPALATEPGSVFVLRRTGKGNGDTVLRRWLQEGLDPQWVHDAYGKTFQTNPFLPTNGYGEIALNLACHQYFKPAAAELGLATANLGE